MGKLEGFPLKRYPTIRRLAVKNKIEKPLQEINDEKEHIQELPLLTRMYLLVLKIPRIKHSPATNKHQTEKINGKESLEGNETILNYSHATKITHLPRITQHDNNRSFLFAFSVAFFSYIFFSFFLSFPFLQARYE